ncbi:hypothetical protein DCAR_0416953 [Daucus carota subsp. sativus]|uniref:Protein kinase domain-containing protein n=1 Tax=Daucus carota subsp. sativus TaxID=79200 RepID=A0AAF0WWW5_DAUCS|nr:hypothetical protein DCAR_0416953 [Daucus carota subsp. sativus]
MAADESKGSVDVILDFLKRNKFSRAEAALRSELGNRSDLNGFLENLTLNGEGLEREEKSEELENGAGKIKTSRGSEDVLSSEIVVKEIEFGPRNGSDDSNWSNTREQVGNAATVSPGNVVDDFGFSNSVDDAVPDLYSNYYIGNGSFVADPYEDFFGVGANSKRNEAKGESINLSANMNAREGNGIQFSIGEKETTWLGSTSNSIPEPKESKISATQFIKNDGFVNNLQSGNDHTSQSVPQAWKDCSVKTIFPFPELSISCDNGMVGFVDKREGKRKSDDIKDVRAAIKEQVDEVGRALFFGKSQEPKTFSSIGSMPLLPSDNHREEFPRLAPVKLKSEDKLSSITWEEKFERDVPGSKIINADTYHIGPFPDVPVGQEIISAGLLIQCFAEDTFDLVSGFATVGDGLSESVDYPNEYWDSDEYDDDDDVGYMRQPIEDETWFLAHEIDYPSDNEKGTGHGSVPDLQERGPTKDEDDDQSFAEEDSYLSGENYFQSKNINAMISSDDPIGLSRTEMYGRNDENNLIAQYDGQLMDEEELNLMSAEPVWQGFVTQSNDLIILGEGKVLEECGQPGLHGICMDDDKHGSVRSIGVGINNDAADFGTDVRESLVGGSSEGDTEYTKDQDGGVHGSRVSQYDLNNTYHSRSKEKNGMTKPGLDKRATGNSKGTGSPEKDHLGGFSFPPSDGQTVQAVCSKPLRSNKENNNVGETDNGLSTLIGDDNMLSSWRRSGDSLPVRISRDEDDVVDSVNSSPSSFSNYGYADKNLVLKAEDEKLGSREDPGVSLEDEEAAAVQEQVKQIQAQEEEFETFNLRIVHRKNRTGFEEDKNFHVVLNSVIAGRYHVTEYLGSAAFSKAIQAHDLHSGIDVCVKIIKNNKDFFDQSLDEIKLLKFVNKHDPADKYHILRLYDYFYYREHLLIVCELLKANLYEFHKFNRESGGEVYFTMPRLQSITIQCLEALQFLHGLGLIHCDLKPENILVKSYSRCEVKVIDLGSSCFETDHLCSYVQSRSYRAPEVILGLPYDKKIDIWSLGCILAELCTGNVLFQNDSPATLLARVIGIIGPIDQDMLAKGRDTYKYFTKNHMLYERNPDTNRLEYLLSKKTSLRHRLPMGDQGFVDFVNHLLEVNPSKRPSASEALKHPWLSFPYEPISS